MAKMDWSVPGVEEDSREVMNWGLTNAIKELDKARDTTSEWGRSAHPATVLRQIKAARSVLKDAEKWAVAELREAGDSWAQIGDALGVTRQAAQMRFGSVDGR
jgi:hypothetical protein